MEQIKPTRMELLAKRAQIALAQQGRDLLKQKRNALWKELMKTVDIVLRGASELEALAGAARRALAWAEAIEGREAVQSAAFAARREVPIDVSGAIVAGVPISRIERQPLVRSNTQRGYSLTSTSSWIDTAALRYEQELELTIDLAISEARLRRLAEEIRKTTIRVNALETILLPRLEAERAVIERVLDEREREDLFRLKRVKAAIRNRQGRPRDQRATNCSTTPSSSTISNGLASACAAPTSCAQRRAS